MFKSDETDYDSQDDEQYYYAGEKVVLLDIFVRDGRKLALVEDETEEVFEVFYEQLD